jgi:chemotaxis protein methyltransferase CheR
MHGPDQGRDRERRSVRTPRQIGIEWYHGHPPIGEFFQYTEGYLSLGFRIDMQAAGKADASSPGDGLIMKDRDCIQFLQSALPRLRMRWQGFRKVRGQVCKRIDRRMRELGLEDIAAYRSVIEKSADEWAVLDSLCRVTISRFYRDREVFRFIEQVVLMKLSGEAIARSDKELRCWSIGCASGEEPYTLAVLWDLGTGRHFPSLKIRILATDADRAMIERAREGCYASSSLAGLPPAWISRAFARRGELYCIKEEEREKVSFLVQDIRRAGPEEMFHLILCRNLAFTYFDEELQQEVLSRLRDKLHDRGVLVVGSHERLSSDSAGFLPWPGISGVYVKETNG